MRWIAEITGGNAYTTAEAGELSEIYDDLGSRIATRAEEREITVAFAGGALLLFGFAIGASLRASCAWCERRRVLGPMPGGGNATGIGHPAAAYPELTRASQCWTQ